MTVETNKATSNPYGDENQVSAGWMKFDTPWNAIKGTIVDIFIKKWDGDFSDQKVFALDNASLDVADIELEGKGADAVATIKWVKDSVPTGLTNTPIKTTSDYLMRMTKEFKLWDIVGFVFTHEIPTKLNPAKSIKVFKIGTDEEWLSKNSNSYKEESAVNDEEISVEDIPF